jgi:hypothetical protein
MIQLDRMFPCHSTTRIVLFLQLLCVSAGQTTTCDDFVSNKMCPWTVPNILEGMDNVTDPVVCQSECAKVEECNFFTWVRFPDLDHPVICILYRACDYLEDCGEGCLYSVTGPGKPSFSEACCGQFELSTNHHCFITDDNLIIWKSGFETVSDCQRFCQDFTREDCQYFVYNRIQYSGGKRNGRCSLLRSCDSKGNSTTEIAL